jgi:DNA-binding response OmpR family regulator
VNALGVRCTITLRAPQMLQDQNRQEWLSQAGYRVRIGSVHDMNLDRPADLVIVNVHKPKSAGAQCVREIQAAHPDTPIIAISGQFL